ncbi:hypothetical protein CHS0354_003935 [Potamilus streckersoni]|uniref:Uncharacterized protein n=1 Tax=Potamilus streckersoni TaxID=2493646 RepID=A0AAE0S3Y3_9BIVA|nr:hypothetical protein CHS0354_003935 [Potamilus streckersoni]
MGTPRGTTHDLAAVNELTDEIILEELHIRYSQDIIYTYIGDILVSINPYKTLNIYGDEIGSRYVDMDAVKQLRPHIYALSTRAYLTLQRSHINQCFLVSGESGAGKTECTKMLVAQIVRMSQIHAGNTEHSDLEEKLLEVNPLLEAFGNAQTVINDNSSRFGKLIEIIFSPNGKIVGGQVTEHMLEKSRVVRHGVGEKNFHIFYCMFAGLSQPERKRYFLDHPDKYRIVSPGLGFSVFSSKVEYDRYTDSFQNLQRILPVIGFTSQDIDIMFAVVSAVLHLCNIELVEEPESGQVVILNEEEVDFASILLSVQSEDLVQVLLANINWIRGERVVSLKSVHQAVDGRDALAKALYSRLFSWVVQQVNFSLHVAVELENRPQLTSKVGILDMAGFENFPENSFEQLCINIANEQLQHFFNEHIFNMELQECQAEGIKQPKIQFSDNAALLAMFFQRPVGLFSLLDEECKLAKTSDLTFVEKLNKQFSKSDLYKKARHKDPVFTVVHYAGEVVYSAMGFLEKNRDTLSSNMQSLMENSRNELVNELFLSKISDTGSLEGRGNRHSQYTHPQWQDPPKRQFDPGDSLSRQAGRKLKQKMKSQEVVDIGVTANPNTACAHFRNSLQYLVDMLSRAEPNFVRCLRPNSYKAPNGFDSNMVIRQLKYTGVLETTRIRRMGFTTRLPFQVFLDRYKFLAFPLVANVPATPETCHQIIDKGNIPTAQIGKTKVFLKYWHTDQLNAQLDHMITNIVRIQAQMRAKWTRRMFLGLKGRMDWYQEQLDIFWKSSTKIGDKNYHLLLNQADLDENRYKKEMTRIQPEWYRDDRGRLSRHEMYDYPDYEDKTDGYSRGTRHSDRNTFNPGSSSTFYETILSQIMDKWHEIEPDVWCKINYMEYDKLIGKFYIFDRQVTINGGYDEFDGKTIGLGVIRNQHRDEKTEKIRSYIGKGVTLRKDADGNILATRHGRNEVIVKGYEDPANHCLSAEVIMAEGKLPQDKAVKIFDMEEFKSQIGIEMRSQHFDILRLQHLCIVGLSFVKDIAEDDFATPCWLCIVNLSALDALQNQDVKNEMEQKFAELSMKGQEEKGKELELQKVAERHARRWSKLNTRQGVQAHKEPLRKTRLQIKKRGENVKDRMDYSWDDKYYNEDGNHKLSITKILEEADDVESLIGGPWNSGPSSPSGFSVASSIAPSDLSSPRRDWAKLRVTMKEEKKEMSEAMMKAKKEGR